MGLNFPNIVGTRMEATGLTPPTPPFTMAVWSRIETEQTQVLIQFGDDSDNGSGWYLVQSGAFGYLIQENDDAGTPESVTSSSGVTINTWQHVAVRFESTTNRNVRFLQSNDSNTNTLSHPTGVDTLRIAAFRATSAETYTLPLDGSLGDLCIWDVALTDAEIDLMAVSYLSAGLVRSDDIVGWWPLDRDTGNEGTAPWGGTMGHLLKTSGSPFGQRGPPLLIMPSRQEYILPPAGATDQSKWSMLHYGQVYDFQVALPES